MATKNTDNGRVRGWLLLKVGDPEDAVNKISKYFKEGKEQYVVIRADIVSFEYNVFVPVDAKNKSEFNVVKDKIEGLKVADSIAVAQVIVSKPDPPHDAHGYVTETEFNKGKDKKIKTGRQISESPGANPWG